MLHTKFTYRYNKKTDKLEISTAVFNKKDIGIIGMRIILYYIFSDYLWFSIWFEITFFIGKFIAWIFRKLNIIKWQEDDKGIITCNNLTLINYVLIRTGPMKEPTLTLILLLIQVRN